MTSGTAVGPWARGWVLAGCLAAAGLGCSDSDANDGQGSTPGDGLPSLPFQGPGVAGSGGGAGADGTSSGSGLTGSQCASGRVSATRVKPSIVVVVDGSSSMREGFGRSTRWEALRQALVDPASGVISQLEEVVDFGLVIYAGEARSGGGLGCPFPVLPIDPLPNNYQRISDAYPNAAPGRFTPTGVALDLVFQSFPERGPDSSDGPQYVILATDGEPNDCFISNEQLQSGQDITNFAPSIEAALAGQRRGITMYVISLAPAAGAFASHLQEMANIGAGLSASAQPGASVYSPTTPEALADDLLQLVGGAVTCDVRLNGRIEPGSACRGSVTLNGEPLACDDPNGWTQLDDRQIRLQGTACSELMSNPRAFLVADFPCDAIDLDDLQ